MRCEPQCSSWWAPICEYVLGNMSNTEDDHFEVWDWAKMKS